MIQDNNSFWLFCSRLFLGARNSTNPMSPVVGLVTGPVQTTRPRLVASDTPRRGRDEGPGARISDPGSIVWMVAVTVSYGSDPQ